MSVPLLQVEVRSRRGLIFQGELASVTSYNKVGTFDILPGHSNFVSMISEKVILRKDDGKMDEVQVDNGVIVVEDNKVKIFLGIGKVG